MGEQRAGPRLTRAWCCPSCKALLGTVAYRRGEPPELVLADPAPLITTIRGGVVRLRCPRCDHPIEWRIRPAA